MRRMIVGISLVAIGAFSAYGVGLWAQEPDGRTRGVKSPAGIYETKAEVDAALEKTVATRSPNDLSTSVFDSSTSDGQVQLRRRRGVELAHSMHPDNEINFIVSGEGVLTTGGTLPAEGSKEGIKDGTNFNVKAGDWVIVPMGTAHFWSNIPKEVTYIQIRFGDPKK